MQERRWMRWGGWASLAAGVLSLAAAAAAIAALTSRAAPAGPALAETLAVALGGVAVAVAVRGVLALFAPAPRVLLAGSAAGWLAAAGAVIGAAPTGLAAARYFASVPLGFWVLCVAAAGWRLKRLPAWLRVVGAVLGALLMILPAVPELHALALLLGLAWWFGLGGTLLRLARAPHDALEAPARA